MNTLFSLSTTYQENVQAEDYEIIVVENSSDNNLDADAVENLPGQFRYTRRDEPLPTPVNAINCGAELAKAPQLCIMVDGARMITPGLVNRMLESQRLYPNCIVSVPGYHLGDELQQDAVKNGYSEAKETALLESINWEKQGYRLFEISTLSGTSRSGFFLPIGESNTLGVSKSLFDELGGFETRFTDTGGGQCNLDFYKRAVENESSELVLLLGEGSFHQFHGGVTTGKDIGSDREVMMQRHFDQYRSIRGEYYSPPLKEPIYFGSIPEPAMKFVHHSAQAARRKRGELAYPDWEGEIRHQSPTDEKDSK